MTDYIPNAGQTYRPIRENIHIPFLPFEKPRKPEPLLPELTLRADYAARGFALPSQKQHFLPGVTAKMMDWFWANMEKCYYLWAPGSHKRFSWVQAPADVGFCKSVHKIAESCAPGLAVFGGDGIEIRRLDVADFFPLEWTLSHVLVEGVFNDLGEMVDSTIHMWEDRPGGCDHITATVQNTKASAPPAFILELLKNEPDAKIVPNFATEHEDYEASQWPVFLPKLYSLWEHHPDPSQNVQVDLTVEQTQTGYRYLCANGPVTL